MALTALTVTTSSRFTPATLPASSGTAADIVNFNSFANDGNTIVIATNTDASTRNLTVPVPGTVDSDRTITSRTHPITAAQVLLCGPYPVSTYGSTVEFRADNALVKFNVVRLGY